MWVECCTYVINDNECSGSGCGAKVYRYSLGWQCFIFIWISVFPLNIVFRSLLVIWQQKKTLFVDSVYWIYEVVPDISSVLLVSHSSFFMLVICINLEDVLLSLPNKTIYWPVALLTTGPHAWSKGPFRCMCPVCLKGFIRDTCVIRRTSDRIHIQISFLSFHPISNTITSLCDVFSILGDILAEGQRWLIIHPSSAFQKKK